MQDSQTKRLPSNNQTQRLSSLEEEQTERQLMQDTHLLLENLAEREKVTVKAILDGLYEVGSARLINQRVSIKALRGPLKGIAHFSKPVFRLFAWRWFKNNCPQLITSWLFNQVRFGDKSLLVKQEEDLDVIDVVPVPDALPPLVEKQAAEILALRGRITLLTGAVVLLVVIVFWNVFA